MAEDKLEKFANQSYLNLETFKKNGSGVKTPVWFVEEDGSLYVTTSAGAGKVKRIWRNSVVRVVPGNALGTPAGEWVAAHANVLNDVEVIERINHKIVKKYGLMARMPGFGDRKKQAQTVIVEIDL